MLEHVRRTLQLAAAAALLVCPATAGASSHMDAPLITLDDAANTTDVYAFVSNRGGVKYLTTAFAVYPHEEPGIGPNKYNFDDDVLYDIHVATGNDLAADRATISYRFQFSTSFLNANTILQSYLGVIQHVGDGNQNLTQNYSVTKIDHRSGKKKLLGGGIVPPNNQERDAGLQPHNGDSWPDAWPTRATSTSTRRSRSRSFGTAI
jgi:hypothetical protein